MSSLHESEKGLSGVQCKVLLMNSAVVPRGIVVIALKPLALVCFYTFSSCTSVRSFLTYSEVLVLK